MSVTLKHLAEIGRLLDAKQIPVYSCPRCSYPMHRRAERSHVIPVCKNRRCSNFHREDGDAAGEVP